MSEQQPTVDEREGRLWLLDRYDDWALPPGADAFIFGPGNRPWERVPPKRWHYDDHVAKHRT